jgi:hypothetical protein
LLPAGVRRLDPQVICVHSELTHLDNDLQNYLYLSDLQSRNETMFHATVMSDPSRFMPIAGGRRSLPEGRIKRVLSVLGMCLRPFNNHFAAGRLSQTSEISQSHQGRFVSHVVRTPVRIINKRIAVEINTAGTFAGRRVIREKQVLFQMFFCNSRDAQLRLRARDAPRQRLALPCQSRLPTLRKPELSESGCASDPFFADKLDFDT